jgi:hypothetical protein
MSPIETNCRIESVMRVNLPLLYDQPRAGIRNKVDGLRPEAVIRVYDAARRRAENAIQGRFRRR